MQKFNNRLLSFLIIGVLLTVFTYGMILLSYLFLIGAMVGGVLFFINRLRNTLFRQKTVTKYRGRTIDSDDWKVL